MSLGRRRLFFTLACAAIGFFLAEGLAPMGGAPYTERVWAESLFGMDAFALGGVGAGIGLAVGLYLAYWRGWADRRATEDDPPAVPLPPEAPPRESKRLWLRRKRKRRAPKRFGKRGH
jgi:hypothetical protein